MQFNLPTTKEEMYTVLNDLFYYYRVKREGFEEADLVELDLTRLEFVEESLEQLTDRATALLKAEHEREKNKRQSELNAKILELNQKISLLEQNSVSEIQSVIELYEQSIVKVENQAIKAGLINSSIVADKTATLEDSKNQKIALITQEKNQKVASLLAEIESLNSMLNSNDEYFNQIHQSEIDAKVIELTEKQEQKPVFS